MGRKGWHQRGYLPHLDGHEIVQHVIFRLHDALPPLKGGVSDRGPSGPHRSFDRAPTGIGMGAGGAGLKARGPEGEHDGVMEIIDAALDCGFGAATLRDPHCARLVAHALLHFDGERYDLRAWCIMPNHVHVLALTNKDHELGAIVRSWKAYSAAKINAHLGRRGRFWAHDYFDRYARNEEQYQTTKKYIEMNPVKAGLCGAPEHWPWGSAGWRG